MLKKAILWPVGIGVFGFTFVVAASMTKVTSEEWDNGILTNLVTRCGGFNPVSWFAAGCSDLRLTHLAPLVLGFGVLAICVYIAHRKRDTGGGL